SLKKVILSDPLGEINTFLEIIPGSEGYMRSSVGLSKTKNRTYRGTTIIQQVAYSDYLTWTLTENLASTEKKDLLETYIQIQDYRRKNPLLYPQPHFLLADEFRTIEISKAILAASNRITMIEGTQTPNLYTALLVHGYGVFRVEIGVEEKAEYAKEVTNCKYKLTLSCTEVV
ncbi:MAG TPA: hypothetical protein VIQ31_00885, partial [Phormidium sp.]